MSETNIRKILIANRGEIAARVIRTCQKMRIQTVAVYSEADRHAPWVEMADEALCLGGASAAESYLNMEAVLQAAQRTQAEAIHPGYGFLSENATFAQQCQEQGIIFIGPNAQAIAVMGDKTTARQLVVKHDVPVVPGYDGDEQEIPQLQAQAERIGYPLMIKAAAGGGGKGMRVVRTASQFAEACSLARSEAQNAFGDGKLLLERYFEFARHIEVQVMADHHGNARHFFERECSIQRRHQKVIEEAPANGLSDSTRSALYKAALNVVKAVDYTNAGTVEFLLDERQGFYFLEMNTRLQVEHPVTEEITGVDLVQWQIWVAEGRRMPAGDQNPTPNGHAIECRLYAEDPANQYLPDIGTLLELQFPQHGERIEAAVKKRGEISTHYDPMIAKFISKGATRQLAIQRMLHSLRNTVLFGLKTNLGQLIEILEHATFQQGCYDTHFLDGWQMSEVPQDLKREWGVVACVYDWGLRESARTAWGTLPSGWRNVPGGMRQVNYRVQGESIEVNYQILDGQRFEMRIDDQNLQVLLIQWQADGVTLEINGLQKRYAALNQASTLWLHHPACGVCQIEREPRFALVASSVAQANCVAPMPGKVLDLLVREGQRVKEGNPLVVMESMKMQTTLTATNDATIQQILVQAGDQVSGGAELILFAEHK